MQQQQEGEVEEGVRNKRSHKRSKLTDVSPPAPPTAAAAAAKSQKKPEGEQPHDNSEPTPKEALEEAESCEQSRANSLVESHDMSRDTSLCGADEEAEHWSEEEEKRGALKPGPAKRPPPPLVKQHVSPR